MKSRSWCAKVGPVGLTGIISKNGALFRGAFSRRRCARLETVASPALGQARAAPIKGRATCGMPILEACKAKTVTVNKRSMASG